MSRVCVLVEGQTEETFVNDILSRRLNRVGVYPCAFLFRKKGGSLRYQKCRKDILNTLKQSDWYVTTMIDFYGLPTDWPGRTQSQSCQNYQDKAQTVEQALSEDIAAQMGSSWNRPQFIPYVQMHEFEALLFSDTAVLAERTGQSNLHQQFEAIRQSFSCPEEINDSYETCPSRRIADIFDGYGKIIDGICIAQRIGLEKIRSECTHFNSWISKLEKLGQP